MFKQDLHKQAAESLKPLFLQPDFLQFQIASSQFVETYCEPALYKAWQTFCQHLKQSQGSQSEKLMLAQVALRCLQNLLLSSQFAQLLKLAQNLKEAYGMQMFYALSR